MDSVKKSKKETKERELRTKKENRRFDTHAQCETSGMGKKIKQRYCMPS